MMKGIFHTGLPDYTTLPVVLALCYFCNKSSKGVLSTFQELFLVLIKLKLNLEERDLPLKFHTNPSQDLHVRQSFQNRWKR